MLWMLCRDGKKDGFNGQMVDGAVEVCYSVEERRGDSGRFTILWEIEEEDATEVSL